MVIDDKRIDLTENSSFSFRKVLTQWLKPEDFTKAKEYLNNFGFQEVLSDNDLTSYKIDEHEKWSYHVFPTGTGKQIKDSEEMERMFNGHTCERCGTRLMPWNHLSLCEDCNNELDLEYRPRIPWKEEKYNHPKFVQLDIIADKNMN